jgi:hypothetical protein
MQRFWLAALGLSLMAGSALAGGGSQVILVDSGEGSSTVHRAYAGLAWTLGAGKSVTKPDIVVGVRSLKVNVDDKVSNGVDMSARFKLDAGIKLDSTRLSYVGGKREFQGNLGLGYSFTDQSTFTTLALQAPYARLGVDYGFKSGDLSPNLELLTIDKPRKVSGSRLACNYGGELPPNAAPGDFCDFSESDIRLKHDIRELGALENGLKIYSFKYKSRDGDFVGVMAQDLLLNPKWSKAVVQREDGHYLVNYGVIGIRMATLEDWNKSGKSAVLRRHAEVKS